MRQKSCEVKKSEEYVYDFLEDIAPVCEKYAPCIGVMALTIALQMTLDCYSKEDRKKIFQSINHHILDKLEEDE
jgi:hypothetical protein